MKTIPPSAEQIAFSERLKTLFKKSGCRSYRHFAEEMGFDPKETLGWFRGRKDPTRGALLVLVDSFHVSIEWLVAGIGPTQTEIDKRDQRNQLALTRKLLMLTRLRPAVDVVVDLLRPTLTDLLSGRPVLAVDIHRLKGNLEFLESRIREDRETSITFDWSRR
jgi:hypothetical protein